MLGTPVASKTQKRHARKHRLIVDLLAGGPPQIDAQALLPSVALLGLGSNGSPEHVQRAQRGGPQLS